MSPVLGLLLGPVDGALALTDTDVTTSTAQQTLTLKSGYGRAGITNAAFIADKFRLNERVAVYDGATLIMVGKITAISTSTPSIGVTPMQLPPPARTTA
jgi:hypothetical protein